MIKKKKGDKIEGQEEEGMEGGRGKGKGGGGGRRMENKGGETGASFEALTALPAL